jgi:hypothetical protein
METTPAPLLPSFCAGWFMLSVAASVVTHDGAATCRTTAGSPTESFGGKLC